MRIAIVTETWPPEVNGVALTVQSLAHGLQRNGHVVEVIRPIQSSDRSESSPPAFAELLVSSMALPRYPGLRLGMPSLSRLLRHWRSSRPQALYVATEGPLGHGALSAAKRLGIPACTGFHTRFDDFIAAYGFPWLTPLVFAGMRRFHNRAQATLVPTGELADFLRQQGFSRISLLRRAVDTELFHPRRRSESLRKDWGIGARDIAVIHVGRLAKEKNLDLAVQAFRQIQHDHPGARLVIVGDGPERARIALANPDIVFAGMRHGEDLSCHYASGDLFLFPSTSETFGNVTIEAMACGLPVIAFDYGAAREHIVDGQCGIGIPIGDRAAFVSAARQLASAPSRRARMGRAARAAVASLSPDSVNLHFSELLESLVMEAAA